MAYSYGRSIRQVSYKAAVLTEVKQEKFEWSKQ